MSIAGSKCISCRTEESNLASLTTKWGVTSFQVLPNIIHRLVHSQILILRCREILTRLVLRRVWTRINPSFKSLTFPKKTQMKWFSVFLWIGLEKIMSYLHKTFDIQETGRDRTSTMHIAIPSGIMFGKGTRKATAVL